MEKNNNKQLRIAIFTDSFYPMISGVVTSLVNLSLGLAERGHFVLIVIAGKNRGDLSHKNIRVETIPGIPTYFNPDFKWSVLSSPRMKKIMKKENIQAVHFMTPLFTSYVGIKIARSLNIPVIGTFHTFIADPTNIRHIIKGKLIDVSQETVWGYSNFYYNAADINTTPTESTRREMLANGSTVEIRVLSNGIDPSKFDNSKAEDFKKLYNLEGKTILYFGRVSQDKNMEELFKVFELVHKEQPDTKLLVVGDGPQLEELKEYASGSKACDNIIFTGGIPHQQLITSGIFRACEVFVTPSLTETQSITILEALANEIPCVGFDIRAIPDIIQDDFNGRIVPVNDSKAMAQAVIEILTNNEKRIKFKAGAKESIKKHLLPAVISEWEMIYNDVISAYKNGEYPVKKSLTLYQLLGVLKKIRINYPWKKNSASF